jgi:hypothetical protein
MTRTERKSTPRFRINPIELVIFSTVVLVFLNSAYHLVEEGSDLSLAALSPPHERPSIQSRGPASLRSGVQQSLADTPIPCERASQQSTTAPKTRLVGEVCLPRTAIGPAMPHYKDRPASAPHFKEASVKIAQSGHTAHIFVDPETGKFVTDYIPLAEGPNDIQMTFTFTPVTGKEIVETRSVKVFRSLANR